MIVRLTALRWMVFGSLFTVLIGGLAGCGSGGSGSPAFMDNLVSATGTVILDGEPLDNATIFFQPEGEGGEVAVGTTDEQGKYEMRTMASGMKANNETSKGAVPGRYRVVINKMVMPDGSPIPEDITEADAEAEGAKQVIPSRYSDPEQTALQAEVNDDPSVNDFDLKSGR